MRESGVFTQYVVERCGIGAGHGLRIVPRTTGSFQNKTESP
jgi:hypothetical protein